MFNEYQRSELKTVLAEKFKKKFKNQDGKWIEEQVTRFIDTNDDLTSTKLKSLERAIGNGVDPLAPPSKKGSQDNMSNHSGISRMSGATDFDKFDDKSRKKKSKKELE